jgi:hypothetical protein
VVGFAAGLSPDIIGRLIAQALSEWLNQQFINLTQGWAVSQKISLVGEIQLVSSTVPALTSVRPGKAAASVVMGDPQSEQK